MQYRPVDGKHNCTVAYCRISTVDGDFWENNYIYTLLHGDIIPTIGGNTHFVDSRLACRHLFEHYKTEIFDVIKNKSVVIDVNDIPDFKDSQFLHWFNEKYNIAKHPIISKHRVTNESGLYYAHKNALIDGWTKQQSQNLLYRLDDILMNNEEISYMHSWTKNDLLIWDNTAVLHRAVGGYNDPRRLYRVQAWIK